MRFAKMLVVAGMIFSFVNPAHADVHQTAADYLVELGKKFYDSGNYEEAKGEFRKAVLVNPQQAEARKYLEMIAAEEREEAVEEFPNEERERQDQADLGPVSSAPAPKREPVKILDDAEPESVETETSGEGALEAAREEAKAPEPAADLWDTLSRQLVLLKDRVEEFAKSSEREKIRLASLSKKRARLLQSQKPQGAAQNKRLAVLQNFLDVRENQLGALNKDLISTQIRLAKNQNLLLAKLDELDKIQTRGDVSGDLRHSLRQTERELTIQDEMIKSQRDSLSDLHDQLDQARDQIERQFKAGEEFTQGLRQEFLQNR